MKKLTYLLAFTMFMGLSSCGGSEICNCADTWLEVSKEMKAAGTDAGKFKAIQDKHKEDLAKCEKLGVGKTPEELKKMEVTLKECESFKEMEKMQANP
jgi:hypothetical protein